MRPLCRCIICICPLTSCLCVAFTYADGMAEPRHCSGLYFYIIKCR